MKSESPSAKRAKELNRIILVISSLKDGSPTPPVIFEFANTLSPRRLVVELLAGQEGGGTESAGRQLYTERKFRLGAPTINRYPMGACESQRVFDGNFGGRAAREIVRSFREQKRGRTGLYEIPESCGAAGGLTSFVIERPALARPYGAAVRRGSSKDEMM